MQTATSYLGFRLAHPFVASASPLGWSLDSIRQLEDGGCAAIVLPSLFEEQITLAAEGRIRHMDPFEQQWKAALTDYPSEKAYGRNPAEYVEHLAQVKRAVSVPVIGSLNGTTPESWLTYSRLIEQAGADALELNLYEVVTDFDISGAAIEHQIVQVVKELKEFIRIPIAVKLSPFFASPANLARQLDRAGADALVLYNRFYQPDIDTGALQIVPQVELSTSAELLLRLRWMAILHGRVRASLGLTGGVATPNDGIKAILAGADVVHLTSAILRHGPSYFGEMRRGLESWMEAHGFDRCDEVRGRLSLKQAADPAAFERANYIRVLHSWKPVPENAGGTS
jgi:dihydroorotate dehydrogenase (fumarate)